MNSIHYFCIKNVIDDLKILNSSEYKCYKNIHANLFLFFIFNGKYIPYKIYSLLKLGYGHI